MTMKKDVRRLLAEMAAENPEWAALYALAASRRTRIYNLGDGECVWFHGGSRPADVPGMSYATMRRWLLLPAHKRPPINGDTGQPMWDAKVARKPEDRVPYVFDRSRERRP